MVSPEAVPYAKVGGLADVVGSFSRVLKGSGHDVRLAMPLYGNIERKVDFKQIETNFSVFLGGHREEVCSLWEVHRPNGNVNGSVTTYFFEHEKYFGRNGVYGTQEGSFKDNDKRFAFMCRAALDLCRYLKWIPDVIHCHDWTTSLIPIYLDTVERKSELGQIATVLTVHNLEHQGVFERNLVTFAGLPDEVFTPNCLESMGSVNMLKGGILKATKLTTVSLNYAEEIQRPELGAGLNSILKRRCADLIGILNGIDDTIWNPATDISLPQMFSVDKLEGKKVCKQQLQSHFNLPIMPSIPLFGVVSRMYYQKGLDLLLEIIPSLLERIPLQIVIVGNGEPAIEKKFQEMEKAFPQKIRVFIGYNEELVHQIFAGSDFFLMPSRFEPCGLTQMYAMHYGAVPIVRATGGLVDTVEQYKEGPPWGNGFLFQAPAPQAFYDAIIFATSIFFNRFDEYKQLQANGMRKDFSWKKSANRYEEAYQSAIKAHKKMLTNLRKA